jgi:hypothetical protein
VEPAAAQRPKLPAREEARRIAMLIAKLPELVRRRMTDAELAALEARMIAAAPIVLEATAEVSDDAGDVEDSPPPDSALT